MKLLTKAFGEMWAEKAYDWTEKLVVENTSRENGAAKHSKLSSAA